MKIFTKSLFFITCCLFLLNISLQAQNLVLNPSFENAPPSNPFIPCPGFGNLVNWDRVETDTCSTPDLFSPSCTGIFGITGVPANNFGSQNPHSGNNYAGFFTRDIGPSDYREYVQGRLSAPLVAGQQYCVSFYVSLPEDVSMAANRMGLYFSNTHVQANMCVTKVLPYTPQLQACTSTIITDKTNWVRLQWDYTATGGETYFVIGNFFNNAATTTSNTGVAFFGAYYYIDDVSVIPGTCCYKDIDPVAPLCASSTSITLNSTTPVLNANCTQTTSPGTWSGVGIADGVAGVFTPSVAGAGVHTLSLSLTCGYTQTTTVTVNPCLLSVCSTGTILTVSGGNPPYNWQTQTTYTNCSGCPGGNCIPFFCAGVVTTSWTTVATNTNTFSTNTYPVKILDNAANGYTITSLASVPACTVAPTCPTLAVSVVSQANIKCFGANTGTATVSAAGGATPYTYTWVPGNSTGASQTALSAGIYTVNIRDVNNCPGTGTVSITQPSAALNVSVVSTSNTGCGTSTGAATVSATGGTPTYTYSWSGGGGTNPVASNLSSGSHTVTVTDFNGCTATAVANIVTAGGPVITVVSQASVNCFGSNTGSATVNASGGTGAYSYTWSPGSLSGASQTALSAGIYTINVVDANLCAGTTTLAILQPTSALVAAITASTAASCASGTFTTTFWTEDFGSGCNQGALASVYTGTNGAWAVTATGTNATEANQFYISATENGNAAGACGSACGSDRSLHVGNVAVSSFGLQADGGAAYNAGGLCGVLFCTATDRRAESPIINCAGQSSITLNFNYLEFGDGTNDDASLYYFDGSTWSMLFNLPKTLCCGGAACDGSTQGLWTPYTINLPASANNNPNVRIGFRWVNNDDGVGTDPSFAVDDISLSTTISGPTGGATVTASGGTPSYNYGWTPGGATTSGISGLNGGTYTVQVTDANGCVANAIANITSTGGPTLSLTSQANVNCYGANTGTATVNATGGTGAYTYTWNPSNLTGASQTNLGSGLYTINVSDANQCVGSGTVLITQPSAPLSGILSNTVAPGCGSANGSASITASGGTPSYTYSWSPSSETGTVASNLSAGSNSVTITDDKGCTEVISFVLIASNGPTVSVASQANVNCFGANTGSASIGATGGTGAYSYTWNPGNLSGANQNTLSAGIYTVVVADANLCAGTTTLEIAQPLAALSATVTNTAADCGLSNGSATVVATGGTAGYSYSWLPGTATTSIASNLASGSYSVTVTDNNGCQTVVSTVISNTSGGPVLSIISQTNVTCNGGANGGAQIAVSGGSPGTTTYTWLPSGGNSAAASSLAAGSYTVIVGNGSACTSTILVTITQPSALQLNTTATSENCGQNDGAAAVSITGGSSPYAILWQNGGTSNSITGLSGGSYSVQVTDADNCVATATSIVSVLGAISVDAGTGTTILPGESTQLTGVTSAGASIVWSPAATLGCSTCSVTSASPSVTTTYTIVATLNGCSGSDTVTIKVDVIGELTVPNVFSPNDDGINDIFTLKAVNIGDISMAIFDRWGLKMFDGTSTGNIVWNGKVNGTDVPDGTYFYVIKATGLDGKTYDLKGYVSVFR